MSNLFDNLLDDSDGEVICESDAVVMPRLVNNLLESAKSVEAESACSSTVLKTMNNINVEKIESSDVINACTEKVTENTTVPLSKKARRRLLKRQHMLEHRHERRKVEKARQKERRREKKARGELAPRPQLHRMSDSKCRVRVAIDMAFEKLMSENLICKTLSQLSFCYAANRKAENPLQFYITNLRGNTKTIFEGREGNSNWDVYAMNETINELWTPTEVVYLTADSNNVLERLDESKVYVIGGLIDHNAHKGLCLKTAISNGFSHARLPIDNFIKLKTRKVMTINHVFEILLHFSASKNWEDAFFSVIPARKGAERLEKNQTSGGDHEAVENVAESNVVEMNEKEEEKLSPSVKRAKLEDPDYD